MNAPRGARTLRTTWPTKLLDACQIASESIFDSSVATATTQFAPRLRVPEHFLAQLLQVEDKRFLLHPGVDPVALARAVVANSTGTGVTQGASTITQQLYNIRQGEKGVRRRGLANKLRQTAWALAEETRRSKFEILKEYLDHVYWGVDYYGIDAASNGYFGTHRARLTVAQGFFLVDRLATPNLVRLSRTRSLFERRFFSELFSRNIEAREELIALYDKQFRCGAALRNSLTVRYEPG